MTETDHPLRFGIFPTPRADFSQEVLQMARVADEAGFEMVAIQDHPYQRRFLDTWSLMAFVLAKTDRITVFPGVANLPLRPPRMMAKQAATLDLLSGGRFELGIGAGTQWDGIEAMGGRRLSPKQSVDHVELAIGEIKEFWRGEGKYDGPTPAHDIGIWIGSYKPRMLRLTGALADGWFPSLPYLPPEQVAESRKRIDDAAAAEGRDPKALRRIYNLGGEAKPTVEELADFVTELGFDSIVFAPGDRQEVERLAHDVVPAVREELARRRSA